MFEPFAGLIAELRVQADGYAQDGAQVDGAKAYRRIAARIEAAQREWLYETLTISEAAEETGESYSTIRRKLKSGKIPNVGDKHRPRIRRADLHGTPHPDSPDLAGTILRDRPSAG